MKRMIIFCMLFFCSSVVLTATSPRTVKYRQIQQKIKQLEAVVKDKDAELLHTPENPMEGCLYTAVSCFKKGIQKLQPVSSQERPWFTKAIRIVSKFTYGDPAEQCESTCESYEKKTPTEFLKSFANLMKMVCYLENRMDEEQEICAGQTSVQEDIILFCNSVLRRKNEDAPGGICDLTKDQIPQI